VLLALVVGDLALPDRIKARASESGWRGDQAHAVIFIPYLLFTRQ